MGRRAVESLDRSAGALDRPVEAVDYSAKAALDCPAEAALNCPADAARG